MQYLTVTIRIIIFHLSNGNFINGKEGETDSHDTEDAASQEQLSAKDFFGKGDRKFHDIDDGTYARGNEGSRNGVLLGLDIEKVNREAKDDKGWRNETTDHGKGVLEAHESGQHEGDGFICFWWCVGEVCVCVGGKEWG